MLACLSTCSSSYQLTKKKKTQLISFLPLRAKMYMYIYFVKIQFLVVRFNFYARIVLPCFVIPSFCPSITLFINISTTIAHIQFNLY